MAGAGRVPPSSGQRPRGRAVRELGADRLEDDPLAVGTGDACGDDAAPAGGDLDTDPWIFIWCAASGAIPSRPAFASAKLTDISCPNPSSTAIRLVAALGGWAMTMSGTRVPNRGEAGTERPAAVP